MGSAFRNTCSSCAIFFGVVLGACDGELAGGETATSGEEEFALTEAHNADEDALESPAARPVEVPGEGAFLELGTNTTGLSTPSSFQSLMDGDDLMVELGFQGSYMVVLALRTQGYITEGKVNIRASLRVDGELKASLKYKKKTLLPAADGGDYFYNIFLITEDYADYAGDAGVASVELLTLDDALIVSVEEELWIQPPPEE